jgi:hypothetical protein
LALPLGLRVNEIDVAMPARIRDLLDLSSHPEFSRRGKRCLEDRIDFVVELADGNGNTFHHELLVVPAHVPQRSELKKLWDPVNLLIK